MTEIIASAIAYGIGGLAVKGAASAVTSAVKNPKAAASAVGNAAKATAKATAKVVKGLLTTKSGLAGVAVAAAGAYVAYKSGLFEKLKEPGAFAKIWASLKYVGEWITCA